MELKPADLIIRTACSTAASVATVVLVNAYQDGTADAQMLAYWRDLAHTYLERERRDVNE